MGFGLIEPYKNMMIGHFNDKWGGVHFLKQL